MSIQIDAAKALLEIGAVFFRPSEPFTWASGIAPFTAITDLY